MAVWLDPVFDRTERDVAEAKEQIQKWIDEFLTGNPVETYELKGCLNLSDINRIEGNIQYLSDKLEALCYTPGTSSKTWRKSDLPTASDITRILTNVRLIISSYYQRKGSPSVPEGMGDYSDINAIEENLYNIKILLDSMLECFPKSGTLQVGATKILPIRR